MAKTPFVETEVLLAVMNGDHRHARELVEGMHVSELSTFAGQLQQAQLAVDAALTGKRAHERWGWIGGWS